jgi:A/G-specific adenine glycosylase
LPGTDWRTEFDAALATREAPVATAYRKLDRVVAHPFTHFALQLDIYVAEVSTRHRAPKGCRFVPECDLGEEAFPSVMRKVIAAVRLEDAR